MKLAVYVKGHDKIEIKGEITPEIAYDLMIGEASFPVAAVNIAMQRAFSDLNVLEVRDLEAALESYDPEGLVCYIVPGGPSSIKVCDTESVYKVSCAKAEAIIGGGGWA